MPLSKARDRARKRQERAKSRLDKQPVSPQTLKPVQPIIDGIPHWGNYGGRDYHPEIDADGNIMPDVE